MEPRDDIWEEYEMLPARRQADGWWFRMGSTWFKSFIPWPWGRKARREFRKWQEKWGLG